MAEILLLSKDTAARDWMPSRCPNSSGSQLRHHLILCFLRAQPDSEVTPAAYTDTTTFWSEYCNEGHFHSFSSALNIKPVLQNSVLGPAFAQMRWNQQPLEDTGEGEGIQIFSLSWKQVKTLPNQTENKTKQNKKQKIRGGHRVIGEWHLSVPLVYGGGTCNQDSVQERKGQEHLDRTRRTSMEKGLTS